MSRDIETDVVVVGSGATGSVFAATLAEAGRNVLVLEAGPNRVNADLVSSQLWARKLKWSGTPVFERGTDPIGHVFNAGLGVGGSAMHHFAVWPRMHPEDFACRTRYGQGLDWPLAYEDLRASYDQVQDDAGISGDADREVWRPPGAVYPMPGVPTLQQGEIISRGFHALGMKTAPLPLAVNTIPYKGRTACLWDGWCDAGCPIGALANPVTVYLHRAISAGAVLRPDATVTRILTTATGTRAVGVEFVDKGGGHHTVHASLVVLAAFAIQNPRLLLASATSRHPSGLANANGLVGRYLTSHPAAIIYGLFDEETHPHVGAAGGQLLNQDGYDKTTHAAAGAFGSYQWMIGQATKPNDLLGIGTARPDLFGAELHAYMKRATRNFATMTAVVEDMPVAENRVTLSDRLDAHGVPLAEATHSCDPRSLRLWDSVIEEGKRVFRAAGAQEVWSGPRAGMHILGGTIMGTDPAASVTNAYGQTHEIPNLVIGGSGLFPTSAGVNPTYTAQALALRAAQQMLKEWSRITA
jgi:choline dehydrogenase-like flavoprotein